MNLLRKIRYFVLYHITFGEKKEHYRKKYYCVKIPSQKTSCELILLLKQFSKKNCFNFVLRDGFGDTFFILGLSGNIKKTYNCDVFYMVKPNQEFMLKMYGITNYIVLNELSIKDLSEGNYINSFPYPKIGELFFPHSRFHKFTENIQKESNLFIDYFKRLLNINNTEFNYPLFIPKMVGDKQQVVKNISKIVVLSPEFHEYDIVNLSWWNKLSKKLNKLGFIVICNVLHKNNKTACLYAYNNYSMEELVSIGMNCLAVVSIRNGFCDILTQIGKHLFVFYDHYDDENYNHYSLNNNFNRNDIHEYKSTKNIDVDIIVNEIMKLKK